VRVAGPADRQTIAVAVHVLLGHRVDDVEFIEPVDAALGR
jgi:hypothetical protein